LLQQVAIPVDQFGTQELQDLVNDLMDTMEAYEGAGLAATQIGVMQRVVIFGVQMNSRYPDAETVPMTVLVNPCIEALTNETDDEWEGCLSVPGMRGMVTRSSRIRYSGFDQFGNPVEREADGFHARVVQHECDHLDGVLYTQRISDMTRFGFIEELAESGAFGSLQPCDMIEE